MGAFEMSTAKNYSGGFLSADELGPQQLNQRNIIPLNIEHPFLARLHREMPQKILRLT